MERLAPLGTALGLVALVASLLLTSPGVRVVRAAEQAEASPAPQCALDQAPTADAEVRRFLNDLRAENAVRSGPGHPGIVVLNNRGFNYGPPRGIELDLLRAEAAAARRH